MESLYNWIYLKTLCASRRFWKKYLGNNVQILFLSGCKYKLWNQYHLSCPPRYDLICWKRCKTVNKQTYLIYLKHCGKRRNCLSWVFLIFAKLISIVTSYRCVWKLKRINFLAHLSFAQGELLCSLFVLRPSCVFRRASTSSPQ